MLQVFNIPHFVRLVFCAPLDKIGEALDRTAAFCRRHHVSNITSASDGTAASAREALENVDLTPTKHSAEHARDGVVTAVAGVGGVPAFASPIRTPYR